MDPIKEAFIKIKNDILELKQEIINLKNNQTIPTHNLSKIPQQTNQQTINQTIPTHNYAVEDLYIPNFNSSIRNKGVPTNKQTNQQTNKPTNINSQNKYKTDFKQVNEMLLSLDNIKKEIRLKFKRLTPQEMLVFSTLYTIEEQNVEEITYKMLAKNLHLSESSIRDYINKLIKKGVPIDKIRQNNKTILLKISQDLKNIATLATIQNLREL